MERGFVKMHGTGNDFVFISDWQGELDLSPNAVAKICDRHFGIGADGVILVRKSSMEGCKGLMYYINSDGSLAQMCGNGIRCFSKYLCDYGIVDSSLSVFDVETLSGRKTVQVMRDEGGRVSSVKVNMGSPILDPALVPTALDPNAERSDVGKYVKAASLSEGPYEYRFTCVSMGNPHAVTFAEDVASLDLERIGPAFECSEAFPEKTNVEFARVLGQEDGIADIEMRVWERGCGETYACGTGCCATLVAANLNGLCERHARIHVKGGILEISWEESGEVYMTGPTETVFSGNIEIP